MHKKKYKIFIVTNAFLPELGAAPMRLFDMAKALQNAGYTVEVFTGMPNYPKGVTFKSYQGRFFKKENIDGIPVRRHWVHASHNDKLWGRLSTMLTLTVSMLISSFYVFRQRPDMVVVQYPPVTLPFLGLFWAKMLGAKLMVNVSDLWPSAMLDLKVIRKGRLFRLLDGLETRLYKSADYCLGQSLEILQHIHKKRKSNQHTLLYRTGVDCQLFLPSIKNQPQETPLKIAYAGVLGVAHGVLSICQKVDFKALNIAFHIYGGGFEYQLIKNYIEEYHVQNIYLHELIPYEQVSSTLQQFDALLITQKTSIYGTVPSKLYEAMATGLPVVFNGSGEGAEIVQKFECGWVTNPDDVEGSELMQCMETLKQMTCEEKQKMGTAGRNAALAYFDRQIQIQNLLSFLEKEI